MMSYIPNILIAILSSFFQNMAYTGMLVYIASQARSNGSLPGGSFSAYHLYTRNIFSPNNKRTFHAVFLIYRILLPYCNCVF